MYLVNLNNTGSTSSLNISFVDGCGKGTNINAWAVRDGDVSDPVPEPVSLLLLLGGLAGLVAVKRK